MSMRMSQEVAENIVSNSPFWYWDGWELCRFRIEPSAQMDESGVYNRELNAWGFEKRAVVDEEGYWTFE